MMTVKSIDNDNYNFGNILVDKEKKNNIDEIFEKFTEDNKDNINIEII